MIEGLDINDLESAIKSVSDAKIGSLFKRKHFLYFTGTTDADSTTNFTHSITDHTKAISLSCLINDGTKLQNYTTVNIDATDIIIDSVPAGLQSKTYIVELIHYN